MKPIKNWYSHWEYHYENEANLIFIELKNKVIFIRKFISLLLFIKIKIINAVVILLFKEVKLKKQIKPNYYEEVENYESHFKISGF